MYAQSFMNLQDKKPKKPICGLWSSQANSYFKWLRTRHMK